MIDIAIIGCGIAGLTAGIYGARGGMETVLFEELLPGGQSVNILNLENYPGFPNGIVGSQLLLDTMEQMQNAGASLRYDGLKELKLGKNGSPHTLMFGENREQARTVIIATGANPRKLGVERERELTGRGISYCAACDGALYRDKTVAVVGGGDTSLTDSLVLANFVKKVYLIHRRDEFRGSLVLQQRVQNEPKIEIKLQNKVAALLGEDKLEAVLLHDIVTDLERELTVDALFVAVGVSPHTEFLEGILKLSSTGQIITDERMATSAPGVFAAGDCRQTPLRQVITAAADGAVAASTAIEYILEQKSWA